MCWKCSTGCTSFSFTAGQSYSAVCGVVQGYMYGSPDAFGYTTTTEMTSCLKDKIGKKMVSRQSFLASSN